MLPFIFPYIWLIALTFGCEVGSSCPVAVFADGTPTHARLSLEFHPPPGLYENPVDLVISLNVPRSDAVIKYIVATGDDPWILRSNLYENNHDARLNLSIAREFRRPRRIYNRTGWPNFLSGIPGSRIGCFYVYRQDYYTPPAQNVSKATVVLAQAFDTRGNPTTGIYTATYFVGEFALRYNLPILSIVINYEYLFGDTIGLYVRGSGGYGGYSPPSPIPVPLPNWDNRGRLWERPAHISMFEVSGESHEMVLSQNVGLRIHGSGSRRLAQKAFRIYARSEWDPTNPTMSHDFFDGGAVDVSGNPLVEFERLVLRNAGNEGSGTMIRDAGQQYLSRHLNVDIQASRAVVIYINGEFWGVYHIRERFDDRYVESRWHVSRENVAILDMSGGFGFTISHGTNEDRNDFRRLEALAANREIPPNERFAAVLQYMDVASFIDHHIAKIFFGDRDWPHNNWRIWRYNGVYDPENSGTDGRWRWMLLDLDSTSGHSFSFNYSHDSLGRLLYYVPRVEPVQTQHQPVNVLPPGFQASNGSITATLPAINVPIGRVFATPPAVRIVVEPPPAANPPSGSVLPPPPITTPPALNVVVAEPPPHIPAPHAIILRGLWESIEFRQEFYSRFLHVLEHYFYADAYIAMIDRFSNEIAQAMPHQITRWGRVRSMDAWERELDTLREFAMKRHEYILGFLRRHVDHG